MTVLIVKSSSVLPRIEVVETKNKVSTVVLRKDFQEKIYTDSLTEEEIVEYEYHEVKVYVNNRQNLIPFVERNFDEWFNKGLKLEQLDESIQKKKKEVDRLIKEFEQIKINQDLRNSTNILFEGLAETFEEMLSVESTAHVALMGIVEVYELVDSILLQLEGGV